MPNSDGNSVAARLRLLTPNRGDTPKLAKAAGLATRTLENYRQGRGEPGLSDAARLADAAGVRLEWLAKGELPMHPEEPATSSVAREEMEPEQQLLPDLLENVITGVELFLEQRGLALPPDRKARLVLVLYRFMARRWAARMRAGQPFPEALPGHPVPISEDADLADLTRLV